MEQLLEFFKITGPWAAVILGVWIVLNIIGEICEKKNKIVPEFMKIRKYFQRKKKEKQEKEQLLKDVKILLADVNSHYNADNIEKRNEWMSWVNSRAEVYDASIEELKELKQSIADGNALTLDLYINVNRNRIIDFASKVANENVVISREEFNRIFKVYREYEEVLEKHHMTNGEVDIAYRVIVEAYEERLRDHTFLEDVRGYTKQ